MTGRASGRRVHTTVATAARTNNDNARNRVARGEPTVALVPPAHPPRPGRTGRLVCLRRADAVESTWWPTDSVPNRGANRGQGQQRAEEGSEDEPSNLIIAIRNLKAVNDLDTDVTCQFDETVIERQVRIAFEPFDVGGEFVLTLNHVLG